jgi:hypothetical protein
MPQPSNAYSQKTMQPSEKQKFLEVLAGVHDFYGKDLTPFSVDVWWRICAGSDFEQVSKAFSQHLADAERGQWMPKPADLVRQLDGTQSDRSRRAWGKVLEAAQRVGAYASVAFDEPAIHAAVEDVGGWIALCRTGMDELPHLERRFCQAYRAYIAPGALMQWQPVLLGETAMNNRLAGYPAPSPVLIGDADAAKQTIDGGKAETRAPMVTLADALKRIAA